jgi:hypothetical protein
MPLPAGRHTPAFRRIVVGESSEAASQGRFPSGSVQPTKKPSLSKQPARVKGAGEGAIILVGGLMANAVGNALASFGDAEPTPLSPAQVWLMGSSGNSSALCRKGPPLSRPLAAP